MYSHEIKMKLPSDINFECIIEYMMESDLLRDKNVTIKPSEN